MNKIPPFTGSSLIQASMYSSVSPSCDMSGFWNAGLHIDLWNSCHKVG